MKVKQIPEGSALYVAAPAFVRAAAKRYRFDGPCGGTINTEDLFEYNVVELDKIYQALNRERREKEASDSLLTPTTVDEILEDKIAIVKAVVAFKQEVAQTMETARQNRERLQFALEAREKRRRENMTDEELTAIIESGGAVDPFSRPRTTVVVKDKSEVQTTPEASE